MSIIVRKQFTFRLKNTENFLTRATKYSVWGPFITPSIGCNLVSVGRSVLVITSGEGEGEEGGMGEEGGGV